MPRTFYHKANRPTNSSGRPTIEFKLFGEWDKAIRTIQKISPAIKESSITAQLRICEEISKKVKGHLRAQDLKWRALSPEYLERKLEAGRSGKTLLSTRAYYEAITVWRKSNQHFVFVGVKKGIFTHDLSGRRSTLEIATIAAIHEFSSGKRIPKRPLWNPTLAEMGGTQGIKKRYLSEMTKILKRKGIPISVLNKFF